MGIHSFLVGLDLGQKGDYTAIAVVDDWMEELGGVDPVTFRARAARRLDVRHLERVALGTPYPAVVERVCDVMRMPDLQGRCALLVDATGVGAPVVDLLRAAALDCPLIAVTITGGMHAARVAGGWSVPKRDLVTGLQVSLDLGELRMPRTPMGGELVGELMGMRVKISESGHDAYGAEGRGAHDDLVLALGLACWGRRFGWVGAGRGRLPGI